jgi:hypothetical protein
MSIVSSSTALLIGNVLGGGWLLTTRRLHLVKYLSCSSFDVLSSGWKNVGKGPFHHLALQAARGHRSVC